MPEVLWSNEEIETLRSRVAEGMSDTDIALELNRTQSSVSAKIGRMHHAGLITRLKRGRALTMWSTEDEEAASKLWRQGLSASLISKALDRRHSRNAVIGKMFRLGVETPSMQPKGLKPKTPKRVRPRPLSREEKVAMFYNQGLSTHEIALRQHVRKVVIVEIMLRLGLDPTANDPERYNVHPMWSMNEDDRRMAFYEKFQTGWLEVQKRLATPHA